MTEPIFTGHVDIEARFDGLNRDLNRAEARTLRATNRMEAGFRRVGRSISPVQAGLGAFAALGVQRAFTALIRNSIALADSLDKTAIRLSVNVEELQRWRFAANQAGIANRQFDIGLQRFIRRVGEARNGTGELLETLERLDVDFQTGDQLDVLNRFFAALERIEDPAIRLAAVFKAFDSEGVNFIQLLRDGSDGLEEMLRRADELGVVMEAGLIGALVETGDRLQILEQQVRVTGATFAAQLSDEVIQSAEVLGQIILAARDAARAVGLLNESFADFSEQELVNEIARTEMELSSLRGTLLDTSTAFGFFLQGALPVALLSTFGDDVTDLEGRLAQLQAQLEALRGRSAGEAGGGGESRAEREERIARAQRELVDIEIQRLRLSGDLRTAIEIEGQLRDAQIREEFAGLAEREALIRDNGQLVLDQIAAVDRAEREAEERREEADRRRLDRIARIQAREQERAERERERAEEEVIREQEGIAAQFADIALAGERAAARLREALLRAFLEEFIVRLIRATGLVENLGDAARATSASSSGGSSGGSAPGFIGGVVGRLFSGSGREVVTPRLLPPTAQQASNAQPRTEVIVNSPLPTQTRRDSGAGQGLERLIIDVVSANTLRGGQVDAANRARYGLQAQGTRR